MSGPQFAHIQTWSRKSNKAGQSINHVIAEANRDPEFSTHVENPVPPRVLLGNPATFAADHAAHVAARSTIAIMADGSQKSRAIRNDRHTMASIVMSYPVPRSAIVTDEAEAKLAAWEKRNLDWLREKYGDQLRVAMAHDDETQPHLHAWLLPDDPGADATTLHPGKVAKKEVEAKAKAENVENREAVKLGNRALKAAMTVWQDEYHAAVGVPGGLTRSGPKRQRLSRQQWKAQKATAVANAAALERAAAANVAADQIEAKIEDERESIDLDRAALVVERASVIEAAKTSATRIVAGAEARALEIMSEARQAALIAVREQLQDDRDALDLDKTALDLDRSKLARDRAVLGADVSQLAKDRAALNAERVDARAEIVGERRTLKADRAELARDRTALSEDAYDMGMQIEEQKAQLVELKSVIKRDLRVVEKCIGLLKICIEQIGDQLGEKLHGSLTSAIGWLEAKVGDVIERHPSPPEDPAEDPDTDTGPGF